MLIDNGRRSRMAGAPVSAGGGEVGTGRGVVGTIAGACCGAEVGVGLGVGVAVGASVGVGTNVGTRVGVGCCDGAACVAVAVVPQAARKALKMNRDRMATIDFLSVCLRKWCEDVDFSRMVVCNMESFLIDIVWFILCTLYD